VRISSFGLQADLDRNLLEIVAGEAAPSHLGPHPQYILLTDIEAYIDRIGFHDGGQHCGRGAADKLADGDLPRRHDAVERRLHMGVVVVESGKPGISLGLEEISLS
jgi:hypothetical protein